MGLALVNAGELQEAERAFLLGIGEVQNRKMLVFDLLCSMA